MSSRVGRRVRGGVDLAGSRPALAAALIALSLAGCAGQLDHFGKPPTMSPMVEPRNAIDPSLPATPPVYPKRPDPYRLAASGQYDTASVPTGGASLWSSGPRSLFGDRRAQTVGDILTILIEISDSASISNSTSRSRSGSDTVSIESAFGLDELVNRVIPGDAVSLEKGVSATGDQTSNGSGDVSRDETISLKVAATVVDRLPNGHLVVTGSQEVRVNFELRDLQVAGIIRPEDISRKNTITYDKMANARISYGGRGQISDLQQPRIGQQVIDLVSPF